MKQQSTEVDTNWVKTCSPQHLHCWTFTGKSSFQWNCCNQWIHSQGRRKGEFMPVQQQSNKSGSLHPNMFWWRPSGSHVLSQDLPPPSSWKPLSSRPAVFNIWEEWAEVYLSSWSLLSCKASKQLQSLVHGGPSAESLCGGDRRTKRTAIVLRLKYRINTLCFHKTLI